MKKIVGLFLVLLFCLSLAACADNEIMAINANIKQSDFLVAAADSDSETLLYDKDIGILENKFDLLKQKIAKSDLLVYVNDYYFDQGGPVFELNDGIKRRLINNFSSYMELLDYSVAETDYTISNGYILEATIDGVRFVNGVNHISVDINDVLISEDTDTNDVLNLLNSNPYLSAACEFLDINDPLVDKKITYNNLGQPSYIDFIITNNESNITQSFVNANFKNITLSANLSGGVPILYINHIDLTAIENTSAAVSYDDALKRTLSDNSEISKNEILACEIFYSSELVPGYFIPCYKFYIDGGKQENSFDYVTSGENITKNTQDLYRGNIYYVAAYDISQLQATY